MTTQAPFKLVDLTGEGRDARIPPGETIAFGPGLSLHLSPGSQEALLETLIPGGELSVAELEQRTGLRRGVLRQQLARLVTLGYAIPVDGKGTVYRAEGSRP